MNGILQRLKAGGRTAILCGALLLTTAPAFADPISAGNFVRFLGSLSQNGSGGGPFRLDVLNNGSGFDFLTFCLQRTQFISYTQAFVVGSITNAADDAGGPDPISTETAWVYSNFRRGLLGNFTGDEVQAAIWVLENEWLTQFGNSVALIALAQSAVQQGWQNDGVKVLNLFYQSGLQAQDQLTYTPAPEPASLLLLGSGLAAAARIVRRRRKPQR